MYKRAQPMIRSHSRNITLGARKGGAAYKQLLIGTAFSLATWGNLYAGESLDFSSDNGLAESAVLSQELLLKGDAAYKSADYKEAVSHYKQLLGLGLSGDVREAGVQRFAQASVEYAKKLARLGDYVGARAAMEEVLSPAVDPMNKTAQVMLAKLNDPIRYNPALTVEHSNDTEKVRKWLYKAESFYNLGKFDDALLAYEEVLRIDRYNKAARRGMERVNQQMVAYGAVAYDQTRAELLKEVDASWELNVPRNIDFVAESVLLNEKHDRIQEVRGAKLKQIVIPVVDFQESSIFEAYDVIREWARQYDVQTLSEAEKGLNFVLNLGGSDSETYQKIASKVITLNVRNVPLERVLEYVSQATATQWTLGDHAVVVTPSGTADTEIRRRTFRVPPGFMQNAASSVASQNDDPFADEPESSSVLSARVSAKEYFSNLGVSFPDGATAKYIPASGSLIVANTLSNLNLVEEYIREYSRTESIQVVMRMTFMDVAMGDLEELGFDWLVGNTNDAGNSIGLGGGSISSGRPFDGQGNLGSFLSPVTAGNRSGDSMFSNQFGNSGPMLSSGSEETRESASSPLVLTTEDVQVIMRGLSQKGSTDILEAPSVIARPGEKATLYSGQEFIYPTEYEPAELPNTVRANSSDGAFPVTPAHPTAFESRLTGVTLETEVSVSDDRQYVDVQMDVERVEFEGFVNYGSPIQSTGSDPITGLPIRINITDNDILQPIFRTIRPNTAVTVQDGANIVIAGLQQSDIEDVEDKVPVLGDIPLVGRFFQSKGTRRIDRALLIFVNVEVQDPTGQSWNER